MKNIKRFQNDLCQNKNTEKNMDRLMKVADKNSENIAVFFSGIISSFISAILSMIITTTNFVDNVLVRIALILSVFLFIWFILAKYVIPFITYNFK